MNSKNSVFWMRLSITRLSISWPKKLDISQTVIFQNIFNAISLKRYWQNTCVVSSFCLQISLSGSFPEEAFTFLVETPVKILINTPCLGRTCVSSKNVHLFCKKDVLLLKSFQESIQNEALLHFVLPLEYPSCLQVGKAGIWTRPVTKCLKSNDSSVLISGKSS